MPACDHVPQMLLRSLSLALVALLTWAAQAGAQQTFAERRAAAEDALAAAQRLADGRGIRTGRELTTALLEVTQRRSALSRSDRAVADSLLGRPTDPGDTEQTGGPYTVPSTSTCTTNFCVHWVTSTEDRPDLTDGADADSFPDYVNLVMDAAEQSFAEENTGLGWQPPKSDGTLGGDNAKTDVYIKELNPGDEKGLYGYANTDPPQSTRSQYGFLVLDDDYNADEFPDYLGVPDEPIQVTMAHEYNHVLQFGYDILQDTWMYESTATWAEDKVYPAIDDYLLYLQGWRLRPGQPMTAAANGKEYGSAVWNHWLDGRYGPEVVRDAWAGSDDAANTVQGGGFAPKAYDAAIKAQGGVGFAPEFGDFAAATATWEVPGTGFHEGDKYGDVRREATLAPDGALRSGTLDHTGFAQFDVAPTTAGRLDLSAALPDGTAGYIALVGRGSTVDRAFQALPSGGGATVSLPDPATYSRITAVLVNSDTQHAGFDADCADWNWTRDDQSVAFALSARGAGDPPTAAPATPAGSTSDCSPAVTPTPTPTATATPAPVPTATPTPTPTPVPRTSLTLSRSTTTIRSAARTGVLALFARTNKAGRLAGKATVDSATARRLKIGRRTTSAGTGRRTATAPARLKLNVKLTRKARAALKRQRSRTLRIKVRVTLAPTDGTSAVARTISILLRP